MERLSVVQKCLIDHEADALILTFLPDIRWLTGFSGSNALVIYANHQLYFITDGRYAIQSRNEVRATHIRIASSNLMQCAVDEKAFEGIRRVIVQAEHLTLLALTEYKEALPEVDFVPVSQVMDKAVALKSQEEKERVLTSQRITDAVFEYLLGFITPGLSEKDIAAEIVYQHLSRGASAMSFDPIVASGPNGALPHARPGNRELSSGDLLVIDMGCFCEGYASDMTRTIAVGEPGQEARKVYQIVRDAQMRALNAATPGLTTQELDHVARSVIEEAGYGAFFSHSLGHGVGLQVHEWPSISWKSAHELAEGMILTIEPGIYLPDKFGVRIEDMIQLTKDGCENLTASSKELIIL